MSQMSTRYESSLQSRLKLIFEKIGNRDMSERDSPSSGPTRQVSTLSVLEEANLSADTDTERSYIGRRRECLKGLLILELYVFFGVLIYASGITGLKLSLVDAIFFCVITFSTVGFNAPKGLQDHNAAMLFTSFYILFGVVIISSILADIAEAALESRMFTAETAKKEIVSDFDNTVFSQSLTRQSLTLEPPHEITIAQTMNKAKTDLRKESNSLDKKFYRKTYLLVIPISIFFLLSCYVWKGDFMYTSNEAPEASPIVAAFYFTVVTISTVGYGDIAPEFDKDLESASHPYEKLVISLIIPFVVVALANTVASVAIWKADKKLLEIQISMLQKGLNQDDLNELDTDGDGEVTMMEFVEFMLISMGKCDKNTIQKLKGQFSLLDTDKSGTLTMEDFKGFYTETSDALTEKAHQLGMHVKKKPGE